MMDRATNEFLNTERARNDENDLFAAIGKRVLGLSVEDDNELPEDDRVKIVDEIPDSLCMNCQEDVSNGSAPVVATQTNLGRVLLDYYSRKSRSFVKLF